MNIDLNNNSVKDIIVFADDSNKSGKKNIDKWKVLIVDDEVDVHKVTKLVLSGFEFEGKKLNLFSAYSAKEAISILENDTDFAVILLDVVMEEDDSGLKLVRYIRNEMKNSAVRIILRTGQPGEAPEQKVIVQYDINDYKAKTELTYEKLFTSVIASLRAYNDIITIEKNNIGLERIIYGSAKIFELHSLDNFNREVLNQFNEIIHSSRDNKKLNQAGIFAILKNGKMYAISSIGKYSSFVSGEEIGLTLPHENMDIINKTVISKKTVFVGNKFASYFRSKTGMESIIYFEFDEEISVFEKKMIEILCSNVSIAFESVYLNHELENIVEIRTSQLEAVNSELSIKNKSIKAELEMARRVQMAFLPESFPESNKIYFAGLYIPMHDLGGDFYDVFELDKNRFGVVMADVSGHGASASLVTAMVKTFFNAKTVSEKTPDEIVTEIHNNIFNTLGHFGIFITLIYAIIDLNKMEISYSNAGHVPGIILGSNNEIQYIPANGTIAGVFSHAKYVLDKVSIKKGDTIVLFTDGLPESKSGIDGMVGMDAFLEILKKRKSDNLKVMADEIVGDILSSSVESETDDDKTLLIVGIS